ncbi:MAG: cache domain-containing protein, partial [Gorillibacterium sp.]|nr:cache domain-containing protein [Gorillibacterium sp.]
MRKPKYRNTIFIRFILSYTILSVVLIGLIGGYLYTQANRLMEEEIGRDNQNRLNAAQNYMEQTLLKKYEDNLQKKAISSWVIQNNYNLNFLLSNGWIGNTSRIASFRQDLEFFKFQNEGATNVTVYFPQENYVIDSNNFYMDTENSEDAAFILKLNELNPKVWVNRTKIDGTETMTYAIKLPFETPGISPKGYFFIDVDMEYLKRSAAQMLLSSPQDKLYIFDSSGGLILNTGGENEKITELLTNAIHSGTSSQKMTDDTLGKVILSHLDQSKSVHGWTFAMYRPMNSFVLSSEKLKTSIFVSCIVVILFGLLISYVFSKQLYIPVKRLVHHIKSLYPSSTAHSGINEYT